MATSKKGRSCVGSLESSGLLDAYTTNKSSQEASGAAMGKPITKKNKNRKKREQQRQEQLARRESEQSVPDDNDDGEAIVDSWEDIQDNDTPDVPPPPEFVIDESAVEERKREKEMEAKGPRPNEQKTGHKAEKTKEEIKAEREAKKKAKQEARAKGKPEAKPKEPSPVDQPKKSNSELKAERRAKQEAQRDAKAQATLEEKAGKAVPKPSEKPKAVVSEKAKAAPEKPSGGADKEKPREKPKAQRKVMLFSHLHQYEREQTVARDPRVPASVVEVGLRCAAGTLRGSNARCLAFMNAMKAVIKDYSTPPDRQLSRDLDERLKTCTDFLQRCRNHSVSMVNAIRFLKAKVNSVDAGTDDDSAKRFLVESIDTFVSHVELAAVQIAITACEKIRDGDVILTFGWSSLLKEVFEKSAKSGRKFRVIVADGRPKFEGREMTRHLVNAGIHCSYVMVHTLSCVISEVSKVFLGAHAVFANGYVMSRVGSAQVAMIAKAQNVPVLVCCETYKFSDRVQTDSFVFNELGDPDDLVANGQVPVLKDWRNLSTLTPLNLMYDVTPANLVDAIISEISVIPCTSVPVVLRLKTMDLG